MLPTRSGLRLFFLRHSFDHFSSLLPPKLGSLGALSLALRRSFASFASHILIPFPVILDN